MSEKKKERAKIYGNRIRQLLKQKGMSPQELSDIVGTTPSHISRIINGKRRCVSLPIAIKIAIALETPVEQVFLHEKPTRITKPKTNEEQA